MPDLAAPSRLVGAARRSITHVVHLAGIAHAPGLLPDEVYSRINAEAVGELAAAAARGKIERFVLMSSVRAQAGLSADHAAHRDKTGPSPPTLMGAPSSKPSGWSAESGVTFTVLRPAVVYGKGVKGNIAALATLAKTPMPLPFAGLDNRRSLLALDNLIAAISLVLERRAGGERNVPRRRCRADQRGRYRRRHARGAGTLPSSRAKCRSAASSG